MRLTLNHFISEPSVPQDLSVIVLIGGLHVNWTAPEQMNGVLNRYEVQYSYLGGATQIESVESGITSVTLTELVPCREYAVTVKAVTGGGPGPASDVVYETTLYEGMVDFL